MNSLSVESKSLDPNSTLIARNDGSKFGDNVFNLQNNTFNGRKLDLVAGDPSRWTGIQSVTIHETTRGTMSRDDAIRDQKLSVNSDAVITQNAELVQYSLNWRRSPDHGIAGGIGTQVENRAPGTKFDIEIDYNAQTKYVGPIPVRGVTPITDAQYHVAAKAVADAAVIKFVGLVQDGASRRHNDYSPVLTVEPHRYVDRGLPDAHTDPRNFDTDKFKKYVQEELRKFHVPASLVKFEGW
jgi:hypothetical protein